jgi:2-desacetyl-2-hydroxyethyl bacteriochlorophyllide A dehydrogenase
MSPITIRKATLYGAGDLRLDAVEYDVSALADDEALVRTEMSGLSTGTDLGNYDGRSTEVPGAPGYPRAVGYSNAGRVWRAGSRTSFQPGQAVFTMKPHCSAFVATSADLVVPIPDGVPMEQAALAYLINLGVAALRQAGYEAGERVTVVGLGVIGLSTVAAARAMGAQVSAVANHPDRANLAVRMGARGAPAANESDIVVLTANSWEAYRTAVELARRGGRIAVLGFPGRGQPAPDFNPLDASWLYAKQLTVMGSGFIPRVECLPEEIRFNLRRNVAAIFEWMASGALDLGPMISHRVPYDRMRDAYELARRHDKSLTAAVFDWREAHR